MKRSKLKPFCYSQLKAETAPTPKSTPMNKRVSPLSKTQAIPPCEVGYMDSPMPFVSVKNKVRIVNLQ